MRARCFLLALVALAPACAGEVTGVLEQDAGGLDASVQPSDAFVPDASTSPADASVSADAALEPTDAAGSVDAAEPPDAAGPGPDAASPGLDAAVPAPPDAAAPGLDAAAAGPDASAPAGPSSTRLVAHPLGTTTAPNGFHEYLPPGYDDGAPRPLLVFWHGIGEAGNGNSDLAKVLATGVPQIIKNDDWPNDRPFVVLMPQHGPSGCPTASEIEAFIGWALTNYRIDPKRAYLTGLSCGAIGSWEYLAQYRSQQVAAAVLVCGDPKNPTLSYSAWGKAGCGLGDVAIWSLHGDADSVVTWEWDKATLANLLACPAPPRRDAVWTPIAGGSHFIWNPIYDLSGGYGDIYAWMLANPLP